MTLPGVAGLPSWTAIGVTHVVGLAQGLLCPVIPHELTRRAKKRKNPFDIITISRESQFFDCLL